MTNTTIEEGNALITYDPSGLFHIPATATHEERVTLGQMIGLFSGPSEGLNLHYDETIEVKGVIFYPASIIDQRTGEVRDGTRVVFLETSGRCLSSFSAATLRFVQQQLLPVFTTDQKPGMLSGPVKILIHRQKTQSGGIPTYALQLV